MRLWLGQIVVKIMCAKHVTETHHSRYPSVWLQLILTAIIYCAPIHFDTLRAESKYAAFLVDNNNGRILYSRNADRPRYPASLTKMMTLYLLFEAIEQGRVTYETPLVVTANAQAQPPSKLGLKVGQTISVRNAIRSLVTKSANDIAVTVAENLAKDEKTFAVIMTRRARLMGMNNTTFRNASGLPDSKQITTARDMLTLSRRLIKDFPRQNVHFRTKYFAFKGKKYKNHNRLLFNFEGTEGIKTGYTRASGFNLSVSVRRGKKHVIGVVFGGKTAKKRDAHMRQLLRTALKKATNYSQPVRIASKPYRLKSLPNKIETSQRKHTSKSPRTGTRNVSRKTTNTSRLLEPVSRLSNSVEIGKTSVSNYDIQVGAYGSETEARFQLENVYKKAHTLLNGHRAITRQIVIKNRRYYRARFVSFNKSQAQSTCKKLETISINCIAMRSH